MKYLKFIGKYGELKLHGFKFNNYAKKHQTWEFHDEHEHYPLSFWRRQGLIQFQRDTQETFTYLYENYITKGIKVPPATTVDDDVRIYYKRETFKDPTSIWGETTVKSLHTTDREEFRLAWMEDDGDKDWFYDDIPGSFLAKLTELNDLGWLEIGDSDNW